MRIAITGGSGRIGRAVVDRALAQGHGVVNIDRTPPPEDISHPEVPFIQTDIGDYDAFERAMRGCDALIHLAAIPSPGRHPDHVVHNNNVVGSYNALRAAALGGSSPWDDVAMCLVLTVAYGAFGALLLRVFLRSARRRGTLALS